jgi:hypothetical protein
MSGESPDKEATRSPRGEAPHRQLHPRWVALIFLAVCVGLIPQILGLSSALSEVQLTNHWRTAWVGLDVAEAVVFLLTAWFIFRRSPLVSITASIAFAMLWLDAWFDVMTAVSTDDIAMSRTLAVFAELPLGIFCLLVALRPLHVLRRPRWPWRRKRPEDG